MVERLAVNERVVGSSPTSGALFFTDYSGICLPCLPDRQAAGKERSRACPVVSFAVLLGLSDWS